MTHAGMIYACYLLAQAIPFAIWLGILVITLRVTWGRWP